MTDRRVRRLVQWTLLTAVAFVALAPMASGSRPYARFGLTAPYTFNKCGGGARNVDPLNVLWYGRNALPSKVARGLEAWGHWDHDDYQSPYGVDHQYVGESGGCFRDDAQRADDCAICNRNHVRLFSTESSRHRLYVIGDAHHDSDSFFAGCTNVAVAGHVASSFDNPRDAIRGFWRHHAKTKYHYWGNTRAIKQCDDSRPHSDGYVLYAGT